MRRSEDDVLLMVGGSAGSRVPRVREPRFRECVKPYSPAPGQWFSCRQCEPCIDRIVHDAVGRCLAESWCCEHAYFVTLTIGSDLYYGSTANNPKARALIKSDVQAYNKRLLKYVCADAEQRWKDSGHDVAAFVRPTMRYFYVGELGDRSGRPHYHLLIFLQGADELPDMVLGQNYFHGKMAETIDLRAFANVGERRTYWPHGFSHIKEFDRNDAYYLAQYCVKSVEQRAGKPSAFVVMPPGRSLRPLLGAGYFRWLAGVHVDQQLPMRDDGYRLPAIPGYMGPLALFHMNRRSKLFIADAYKAEWKARAAKVAGFPHRWPRSEFFDRLDENDNRTEQRVWFEAEQFFQRCERLLALNVKRAAERRAADLVGAYGALKSGERCWGDKRSWTT